jgi:hypothetical protein
MQKGAYEHYMIQEFKLAKKTAQNLALCYSCKRLIEKSETFYSIFCQTRNKDGSDKEASLLAFHSVCFSKLAGIELMSEWMHD